MDQQVPVSQQTSTNSFSPATPSTKRSFPLFLVVAGVLVFGAVCAMGGFLLGMHQSSPQSAKLALPPSPTPTTTVITIPSVTPRVGWKTYDDPSLGVAFQYPSNWTVNNGTETVTLVDPTYTDPKCIGDCPQLSVTIWRKPNPNSLSIPDFIKYEYKGTTAPALLNETITNPIGITFKKTSSYASTLAIYYTEHEGSMYSLTIAAGTNGMADDASPKLDQRLNQFETILDSFYFTR